MPFFAPRLSCWAEDIETSWRPCRKARVCSGGSAVAIGLRASWGMPCGVYITHSASSPLMLDDSSSAPSPFILSVERRFLGVAVDRKGCVAKVIRSAEWR